MDEKFIEVLYQAMGALGVKSQEEFEQGLQLLGEDGISLLYQQYQQDPTNIEGIAQACAQIIQQKQQQQQAVVARMGAQLNYINQLRGKCPEGYEVERYMKGGCVKCKKSSDDPVSRFKKHREGDALRQDSTQLSERIKNHIPKANSKSIAKSHKTAKEAMRVIKKTRNPLGKSKPKTEPKVNLEHEISHSSKAAKAAKVLKKGDKVRKCGEGYIASYKAERDSMHKKTLPIGNDKSPRKHNEYPPHVREILENDRKRLGTPNIKQKPNKITGPNKQNLPYQKDDVKPKSPVKSLPSKINKDMPDNVIEHYKRRNRIKGLK